jgi:hypothetical protein
MEKPGAHFPDRNAYPKEALGWEMENYDKA